MRIAVATFVACTCGAIAHAGEFVVEPDQFILDRSTLHMFGGAVQYEFGAPGIPEFGRGALNGTAIVGSQGPSPSSHAWNRVEYLMTLGSLNDPPVANDRIFIGARALTRSGNSSTGLDRSASIQTNTYTQFHLTGSAVADLSGSIILGLSSLESGGNRFARASIRIARLDDGLPQTVFYLNESNEDIPSSVQWTQELEPGHYSFTLGLQSYSGASAAGDSAVSNLTTNLELNFTAIPSPGPAGTFGVLGLFAARRRR